MNGAHFPRESLAERTGDTSLVVVATATGSVSLGIVPVLLGLFNARLGLDRMALGYVASAESAGVLLGTVLALQLSLRGRVITGVTAGAIIGAGGSLLTLLAGSTPALMLCRALCGLGVGLILGLGNHALGQSNLPERGFARLNVLQGVLSAFASVLLPSVSAWVGPGCALALMTAFFAATLVAIRVVGPRIAQGARPLPRHAGRRWPAMPGLLALGALAFFEFAAIAFWSSVHALGSHAGMTQRVIGLAVAIGGVGAIVAGLVGSGIGLRWGRLPMLAGASALMCAALIPTASSQSPVEFAGALLLFNIGWTTGLIYYSGLVASLAESAFLTGSLAFTIVASAAAAPAATVMLTEGVLSRLLPLCVIACVLSLVLALIAVRSGGTKAIHRKS